MSTQMKHIELYMNCFQDRLISASYYKRLLISVVLQAKSTSALSSLSTSKSTLLHTIYRCFQTTALHVIPLYCTCRPLSTHRSSIGGRFRRTP